MSQMFDALIVRSIVLQPCDLYAKPDNLWGFNGLLELADDNNGLVIDLQPAPQFNLSIYEKSGLKATKQIVIVNQVTGKP